MASFYILFLWSCDLEEIALQLLKLYILYRFSEHSLTAIEWRFSTLSHTLLSDRQLSSEELMRPLILSDIDSASFTLGLFIPGWEILITLAHNKRYCIIRLNQIDPFIFRAYNCLWWSELQCLIDFNHKSVDGKLCLSIIDKDYICNTAIFFVWFNSITIEHVIVKAWIVIVSIEQLIDIFVLLVLDL